MLYIDETPVTKDEQVDTEKEYYGVCFVASKHNNGRMAFHYRPRKGRIRCTPFPYGNRKKYPSEFIATSMVDLYGNPITSGQKVYNEVNRMHLFTKASDATEYYEKCLNNQLEKMDKLIVELSKHKETYRRML